MKRLRKIKGFLLLFASSFGVFNAQPENIYDSIVEALRKKILFSSFDIKKLSPEVARIFLDFVNRSMNRNKDFLTDQYKILRHTLAELGGPTMVVPLLRLGGKEKARYADYRELAQHWIEGLTVDDVDFSLQTCNFFIKPKKNDEFNTLKNDMRMQAGKSKITQTFRQDQESLEMQYRNKLYKLAADACRAKKKLGPAESDVQKVWTRSAIDKINKDNAYSSMRDFELRFTMADLKISEGNGISLNQIYFIYIHFSDKLEPFFTAEWNDTGFFVDQILFNVYAKDISDWTEDVLGSVDILA